MASRGDKLAQGDDYLEPEGADFAQRTWVNEKTSRTTQTEKSKRGGDEENLSRPVTTINCETSATSADNWEFFGEVESKYSQMDSMTYELSGGASGSGLVTLGDFTSRVDGPFGGDWRLPVSPLAVGQTALWVRGKNLKEKWGEWAYKLFTRSPTGAPVVPGPFDEFNTPSFDPKWIMPYYQWQPEGPPQNYGQCNILNPPPAATGNLAAMPLITGPDSCTGMEVLFDGTGGFDIKACVEITKPAGGFTEATGAQMRIMNANAPSFFGYISYIYSGLGDDFGICNQGRQEDGSITGRACNLSVTPLQIIYLRLKWRSGDPELTSAWSVGPTGPWTLYTITGVTLNISDPSQLRLQLLGINDYGAGPSAVEWDWVRDASGDSLPV